MKDLSFHYTTPKMEQRNPDGQRINNRNQQDRKKKNHSQNNSITIYIQKYCKKRKSQNKIPQAYQCKIL